MSFFKEIMCDDAAEKVMRTAKSQIERNEHQQITKIIVRNGRWPERRSWLSFGVEWVISGRTIVISKVKKHGIENETINISRIKRIKVGKPFPYTGKLEISGEGFSTQLLQYNMFDMFVAHAVATHIRDQMYGNFERGALKIEIDPVLDEARKLLDAGDAEAVRIAKFRNMSY